VEKLSASLGRFRAVKIRLIIIFVMENPACHAGGRGFAAGALDSEHHQIPRIFHVLICAVRESFRAIAAF
jgi:hypothetical protein